MSRFVLPYAYVPTIDGTPMSGGQLFFYASGTDTPKNTYADAGLATPNTNPVIANAGGRFPSIWLEGGAYKVVLRDAENVLIWTADPVDNGGSLQNRAAYFYGTGTQVNYTLPTVWDSATSPLAFLVAIDGALQAPSQYVVNGGQLTFLEAPPYAPLSGQPNIVVRPSGADSGVVGTQFPNTSQFLTGNGITTVFALNASWALADSPNQFFVAIDGAAQSTDQYSIAGGFITFTQAPPYQSQISVRPWTANASTGGDVIGPGASTDGNMPVWVGATGQVLGAGYAPSSIPVVATATTTARTLANRFSDFINVLDFGAVGDGVHDDAPAINAALAVSGAIDCPPGNYRCASPIVSSGRSISIRGYGRGFTTFEFDAGITVGMDFTLTNVLQIAILESFSVKTKSVDIGTGIKVEYTVAGFAGRDIMRVIGEDLEICGYNRDSNGWNKGMHLINCIEVDLYALLIVGRDEGGTGTDLESQKTHQEVAIDWSGSEWPTALTMTNCRIYATNWGVRIRGRAEGMNFLSNQFVWNKRCIDWEPEFGYGGRPQFGCINNHFHAYENGVRLFGGVQQVNINGNTFYHGPGASSTAELLTTENVIDADVTGNFFMKYSGSLVVTNGIVLSGNQSANIRLANNIFGGQYTTLNRGLWIKSGVSGVVSCDNKYNGSYTTADIQDDSGVTTNTFGVRTCIALASGQTTSTGVASNVIWGNAEWDTDGILSPPSTNLVIPADKGIKFARVTVQITWAPNSSGVRTISVYRNGSPFPGWARVEDQPTAGSYGQNATSGWFVVSAGDVITVSIEQTSGGDLDVQAFGLSWVSIEVTG